MYLIISTVSVLFLIALMGKQEIKNKTARKIRLLSAVILVIFAAKMNIIGYGYEFGLTYFFLQMSCLAWLFIYLKRDNNHKKSKFKKINISLTPSTASIIQALKSIGQLLRKLIIPTLGSMAISFLVPLISDEKSSNVLIFSIFSFFLLLPILVVIYINAQQTIKKDIIYISSSILLLLPHYL